MPIYKMNKWLAFLSEIMICIFAAECTFGASGRWLTFGDLSIRILLFIICFALSLPLVLQNFRRLIRHPACIAALLFGAMVLVATIIGILNQNSLAYIKADISRLLTFGLLPGVLVVFNSEKKRIRLLDVIFYSAVFVSAATVLLHYVMPFCSGTIINMVNKWFNTYELGGMTTLATGMHRIYLRSQIFLQFAAVYGVWKIYNSTGLRRLLLAFLVGMMAFAIIISMTRGFWLGFVVSVVLVLVLELREWKKLLCLAGTVAVTFTLLVAVSVACYGNFCVVKEVINRFDSDLQTSVNSTRSIVPDDSSESGTPENSTDSTQPPRTDPPSHLEDANQAAVELREQSLVMTYARIKEHLLLGSGLGYNLDSIRSDGKTEYMFLDMLMKMGLIGFLTMLVAYFLPCVQHVIRRCLCRSGGGIFRNNFVVAAYLGVAVTSYVNPFLTSSMGILMLFTVILCVCPLEGGLTKSLPENNEK